MLGLQDLEVEVLVLDLVRPKYCAETGELMNTATQHSSIATRRGMVIMRLVPCKHRTTANARMYVMWRAVVRPPPVTRVIT